MKSLIIAAGLVAGSLFAASAHAAPPMNIAPVQAQGSRDVVTVDYPCGRGWHLGRHGYCRPNGPPPPPRWRRPPPPPPGWHHRGPPRPYWDEPPPPPRYYRY